MGGPTYGTVHRLHFRSSGRGFNVGHATAGSTLAWLKSRAFQVWFVRGDFEQPPFGDGSAEKAGFVS